MNKNIFFILYGCLFFNVLNCSAKGISEEMLIGNWQCKTILSRDDLYDENGNVSETYDIVLANRYDPSPSKSLIVYDKKADNMTVQYGSLEPIKFDINHLDDDVYSPSTQTMTQGQYTREYKITPQKMIYLADDKFKLVLLITVRDFLSKKIMYTNYSKDICEKINN